MNTAYFIYNNKEYPFNFDLLKEHSSYISRVFGDFLDTNIRHINLLSEFDYCSEIPDDSIYTFLNYCQNQIYYLTSTNVIYVNFLSKKYEVLALTNETNNYIKMHHREIIDDFLSIIEDKSKSHTIFNVYEPIISDHISDYFCNENILYIPISSMYRILLKFSQKKITDKKIKNKIECQLVEFLIKYIEKNGSEASFLLSFFDIGYKACMVLNEKLSKYRDLDCFKYVNWTIFKSLDYMNKKQKARKKKERKIIRSNLVETVNDLFKMEHFNQNNQDEDNKSISFMKYGALYTIRSLFANIENKDTEDNKLKISKFDLLNILLKENVFSTKMSILLENNKYIDIISMILDILNQQHIESIINLMTFIEKNSNVIDFVDMAFPYLFFRDFKYEKLKIWIPLVKLLIQNNICFTIIINERRFKFNHKSSKDDFKLRLIMNCDDLSLCNGSEILYDGKKKSFNISQKNDIVISYMISDLVTKKMQTENPMDIREILDIYYSSAQGKYLISGNRCDSSNHILLIKELFHDNSSPLISLIWNLVFSLSEKEIIDISQIIHPIESKILKTVLKMFKSIDIENAQEIICWSKWACDLDSFIPTIKSCLMKSSKEEINYSFIEIDSLLLDLKKTIDYLQKSLCAFWNSTKLIISCQNEYNRLYELKIKHSEISRKFKDMIYDFNNCDINREFLHIREKIVELLTNKPILSEENYIKMSKILEEFIFEAIKKSENEDKINNEINWPLKDTYPIINPTKNIKIFISLINYSKIKRLLTEIKAKKKVFDNLRQLEKCPQMFGSWNSLLKAVFHSETLKEFEYSIQKALNTLDANIIIELFQIDSNLITNPNLLCDIFNSYSGKNLSHNIEVQWILQKIKEISPGFLITIPQFNPNSIVSLIVNIKKNKIQAGPLIKNIIDFDIPKSDENILLINQNFESCCDATISIAKFIYHIAFDKDKIPPQSYMSLKNFYFENVHRTDNQNNICNQMKILFLIAESLDNWGMPKLTYGDTFFLQYENIIYDDEHFQKYPSLLFWIWKHKQCAKQLISKYYKKSFSSNEIPFWLICLRIFSSNQEIYIKSSSKSPMLKIINRAIANAIKSINQSNKKETITFNYVNLLLSNTPQRIKNSDVRMIHDFLTYLSFENCSTNKQVNKIIYNEISELAKIILSNKLDLLFSKTKFGTKEENFSNYFLFSPYEYIIQKIGSKINIQPNFKYDIIKIPCCCNFFNFIQLRESKYLSSPVLFCSQNQKILCTITKLVCEINPVIPSLCSSAIVIKIFSLIEEKVSVSIRNMDNIRFVSTKEKLVGKEPVQIYINPPKNIIEKEQIIIKGDLIIKVKGFDDLILPFEIKLILLPLKVRIRCIQYPLYLDNNNYQIDCHIIKPNDVIDFEIINYYIHDLFVLNADLESIDGNKSIKPKLNTDKESKQISLRFPQVTDITECKFYLVIKLSENFEIKIRCDFNIIPFVYTFEVFDYYSKEFNSDSCRVFLSQNNNTQVLHFRIKTLYHSKHNCRITYHLPDSLNIESTDTELLNEFLIEFDTFSFDITIKNLQDQLNIDDDENYGITLEIEQIQKTIKFEFVNTFNENLDPSKYPCFFYQKDSNNWKKIKNEQEMPINRNHPYIIATPFNYYSNVNNFVQINYNSDNNHNYVTATCPSKFHVKYLKISQSTNEFKIGTSAKSEIIKKTEKKMFIREKTISYEYYAIMGFVNDDPDNWFPAFDEYPNILNKPTLTYEEANLQKAHQYMNDINNSYPHKNDPIKLTSSRLLFNIFKDKRKILNFHSIVKMFPFSLKNKFKTFLNDIQPYINMGENMPDFISSIMIYNLIVISLQIFAEKYKEIESLGFCLQMPISISEINNKIKKEFPNFMFYQPLLAQPKKVHDVQFLKNQEKYINSNKIHIKQSKYKAILFSEHGIPVPYNLNKQMPNFESNSDYNKKSIYENMNFEIFMSLPRINYTHEYSISDYIHCLTLHSEGAILLPAFIHLCMTGNKILEDAEEIFGILFNIYKALYKKASKNKSIFSSLYDRFTHLFEICLFKLQSAGLDIFTDIFYNIDDTLNNIDDVIKINNMLNRIKNELPELISKHKYKASSIASLEWKINE